jgi:maltooligosyltrehalose synthase
MKAPKLLPWYARKAGVPLERANALWRKAVREATAETGWVGNSEYWGASIDIFLRLLDAEKETLCTPSVTPILRSQQRMWNMPLIAMEDMFRIMSANWHRQTGIAPRKAA